MAAPENKILRQRRQMQEGLLGDQPTDSTLTRAIKNLDFYPKVHTDRVKKQTFPGFVISATASVIMLSMTLYEVLGYALGFDAHYERLSVDAGIGQKVDVNLNVTFPRIRCDALHLDVMDAAGNMEINVNHDLYKSPVDGTGRLIFAGEHPFYYAPPPRDEETDVFDLFPHYDSAKDPRSGKFCGPCDLIPVENSRSDRLRKKGEVVECCNTCVAVLDYHKKKGKPAPDRGNVEQCIYEESLKNPGCNIAGHLVIDKVKGKFVFAPGGTRKMGFRMLHYFSTSEALKFDSSHIINHMSFGNRNVLRFNKRGTAPHPLDGTSFDVPRKNLATVAYLLKAVPASFLTHSNLEDEESDSGMAVIGGEPVANTFELSATKMTKVFDPSTSRRVPEVNFVFDFHPMQITHIFRRPPIGRFLLNLCKIVGGFFVVTGMLDRAVAKILST
ncbi:putative endoplasmic reticulum-Golgi intermediate compartment protein 3 [Diplonema papillatum]|nr:putative endoplasmic reticulum-Golgi intermediate compartment protein 3 [Diplonema papillatum]|eukprot:gene22054-33832_t